MRKMTVTTYKEGKFNISIHDNDLCIMSHDEQVHDHEQEHPEIVADLLTDIASEYEADQFALVSGDGCYPAMADFDEQFCRDIDLPVIREPILTESDLDELSAGGGIQM